MDDDLWNPIAPSGRCMGCDGKSFCFCRRCRDCRQKFHALTRDDLSVTCEKCVLNTLTWVTRGPGDALFRLGSFQLHMKRLSESTSFPGRYSWELRITDDEHPELACAHFTHGQEIHQAMTAAVRECRRALLRLDPTRR